MPLYLARLLCRLVGHRRSRKHARVSREIGRWVSKCSRCGVPMSKHGLFGWQEEATLAERASA